MSENMNEGSALPNGLGRAEPVRSGARKAAGKVQATIDSVADQLVQGVSKVADRTVAISERAGGGVQRMAETVQPFVRERPFASSGLALGVGVILGMLIAGRSPRVIYLKPPRA